jgi:hypothetical protein
MAFCRIARARRGRAAGAALKSPASIGTPAGTSFEAFGQPTSLNHHQGGSRMKTRKRATGLIAAASLLAIGTVAQAATPSQADFDTCNKEAQARASSPAASPGGTTGSDTGARAGTGNVPPQSVSGGGASGSSGTSGGTSGSAGTGMSGGVSGSTGTGAAGSTSGGVSGSASTDQQLQGIASSGANDPAYQQAYRECMKRLGF